jgi:hypothetical protein
MGIQVDLVMGVFAAADSFPQFQIDLTQTLINLAKVNFIDGALKRLVLLSERLKAKYIFPFAGQYILIGEKANLNENRAVIPVDQASLKLNSLTDKTIITLNTNESVELYLGEISSIGNNYVEPAKIIKYSFLHQYRDVEYFYEKRDTSKIDLKKLEVDLEVASNKLSNMMMNTIGQNLNYSISIRAKNSDFRWNLNFYENLKWGKHIMPIENSCEIYLDLRLLEGCVRRKHSFSGFTSMHWNQAHIGSRLLFKQNNYNATAHYLLNFLHT